MPPLHLVLEVIRDVFLPPFLVTLVLFGLWLWIFRDQARSLGCLIALLAGLTLGNYLREAAPWLPEQTTTSASEDEATATRPAPSWHWLWITTAGAALLECLGQRLWLRILFRIIGSGLAGWLLLPTELSESLVEAIPEAYRTTASLHRLILGLTIFVLWTLTAELARQAASWTTMVVLFFCVNTASLVLAFSHTARLSEVGTIVAGSLAAFASLSWWRNPNTAPAAASASVLLPGLLLAGQTVTFSEVPLKCFLIASLAPLALFPILLPPKPWRQTRRGFAILLVLGLLTYVLKITMEVESLEIE